MSRSMLVNDGSTSVSFVGVPSVLITDIPVSDAFTVITAPASEEDIVCES